MNGVSQGKDRPDFGFIAIVALVALVASWLLLTPTRPAVAAVTLRRFHLRSHSFAVWAMQFPIPTMYNFANRYQVTESPPDVVDRDSAHEDQRYVNHFPARVLTFYNLRYRHLEAGSDRWLTIESSYRGQRLESRFHAKPKSESDGFDLIRLEPAELER